MKILLSLALFISYSICIFAETVIISASGITNYSVNIPAGKMLVVRALTSGSDTGTSFQKDGVYLLFSGFGSRITTSGGPRYFVGPGQFTVGDTNYFTEYTSTELARGIVFSYDIVSSQGIDTVVATNNISSLVSNLVTIQIPQGKRMRILDGSFSKDFGGPGSLYLSLKLTNGLSSIFPLGHAMPPVVSSEAFEISGPCSISITLHPYQADSYKNHYLTYYFVSDVTQAPSQSVQAPVGSLVVVEKSTNLTNWYPAFISTDQNQPQSYYRLNISR